MSEEKIEEKKDEKKQELMAAPELPEKKNLTFSDFKDLKLDPLPAMGMLRDVEDTGMVRKIQQSAVDLSDLTA